MYQALGRDGWTLFHTRRIRRRVTSPDRPEAWLMPEEHMLWEKKEEPPNYAEVVATDFLARESCARRCTCPLCVLHPDVGDEHQNRTSTLARDSMGGSLPRPILKFIHQKAHAVLDDQGEPAGYLW